MSSTLSTSFCPVSRPGSDYVTIKQFLESDSTLTNNRYDRDQWDDFYGTENSEQSNETQPTKSSSKYSPSHYQRGTIEVWDFLADQQLDYFLGNVVKYVCRAGHKRYEEEIDDLLKAKAYIEKKIALVSASRNR